MFASNFFLSCFCFLLHDSRKSRIHTPCCVKAAALVPFAWNPCTVNCTWHGTDVTQTWPDVPAFHNSTSHRHCSTGRQCRRLGRCRAVGNGRASERHSQAQYQLLGSLIEGSCGAWSHLFEVSNWVWCPMETALSQETSCTRSWGMDSCCVCIGCPLRQRQLVKFWIMVWKKKLYTFKLFSVLENGSLNQKLKEWAAVTRTNEKTATAQMRTEATNSVVSAD